MNALTDDVDPTQEIRNLINELQTTARQASAKAHEVEHERDELAIKLEAASNQITEFRQQFVEISSVLRERDTALENAERLQRHSREVERRLETMSRERNDAQRQRDDAARQRDDALRQRDEAVQRRDENNRSMHESTVQLAAVQKQVLSIRQARDAAQAQKHEIEIKIARAEDRIAELDDAREAAEKAAEKAVKETADFRRQLDAVTQDRDATIRQVADLQSELDEQRRKVLDLAEQKSAVVQADSEQASALAEARTQVQSLTEERDAARNRAQELAREIEEVRQQIQESREREAAFAVPVAELEEIKRQLAALTADRDLHLAREKEFFAETMSQQERLATITGQLATAQRGREEALTSLTAAQKQIDDVIRDRDALREQSAERSLDIEAQIGALRRQVADLEERANDAGRSIEAAWRERDAALEKAARFEQQRLQSIDLAAQLDAAKRDLLNLTADLAEARLQVKFAQALKAKSALPTGGAPTSVSEPRGVEIHLDEPPRTPSEPAIEPTLGPGEQAAIAELLSEKEARSGLNAMRHCFQSFSKTPGDCSLLNELHCHAHSFAESARAAGCVALHRLTSSLSNLVQGLYKYPDQMNPSVLRTVSQTLDFLGVLIKQKDFAKLKDPAKAMIYAVDDDPDNCEAIKMAMESVMLRTHTAQNPDVALAELASGRFDLIFLDVNMPHMGGFELCQHIRKLAIHARTPIVFLTGMTTVENRVQSSLSGANDFVGKPFNLHELSLKALVLILKASLGME